MTVSIRSAEPGDLDEIVAIFLACWRGSYAAVLPPALVERMTDAQAHDLWSAAFERRAGRMLVAVPAAGERPLGVSRVSFGGGDGGARDAAAVGVVESLYVSPAAQGAGIGRALLTAAVDALAEAGATTARLWVFAANRPSLDFYRSQGWTEDGGRRVQESFGEPELRLARTITTDAGGR
ncbi:N-acetyltransferase family protein [Herbiconiux sp. P16]|uniref:GNAT family N-acetyltransferase n=1 Tax=Herbiconiux wuyangfengii TaxID=3342794 RepID=UPI0035BB8460